MTENNDNDYTFQEIYLNVWNPETKTELRHMTVDIIMNQEKLESIHIQLYTNLKNYYANGDEYQIGVQELVVQCIRPLFKSGLIKDASCDDYDIYDAADLERRLQDDDFGFHN